MKYKKHLQILFRCIPDAKTTDSSCTFVCARIQCSFEVNGTSVVSGIDSHSLVLLELAEAQNALSKYCCCTSQILFTMCVFI